MRFCSYPLQTKNLSNLISSLNVFACIASSISYNVYLPAFPPMGVTDLTIAKADCETTKIIPKEDVAKKMLNKTFLARK